MNTMTGKIGAAMLLAVPLCGLAPASALTIYSAGPAPLIKALAEGYSQRTGADVDVFQATTGKVFARLEAEAGNPQADVVISASWDSAADLHERGWLMPYASPNAATVPEAYRQPTYVAQALSALALVWNTDSGTPRPTDWGDLATPPYADLVNLPDPAQSGTALQLLGGLVAARGDEAWSLLQELQRNGAAVAGANAQALNPVLQGAKAAVFGAVDYVAYGRKAQGESIEVIFPASGTVIAPRPMMILASTDEADAARAFVDYVLSEEGQQHVANVYLLPARSDVPAQRVGLEGIPLLTPAEGGAAETPDRAALLQQFGAIFQR